MGVHRADFDRGVFFEPTGRGDIDREDFVGVGQSAGEELVDDAPGDAGGEVEIWVGAIGLEFFIEVQRNGDGGHAEECRLDGGGDGARVKDIDSAVRTGVHA